MNSHVRTGLVFLISSIGLYLLLTNFVLTAEGQQSIATIASFLGSISIITVVQLVIGDVLGDVVKGIFLSQNHHSRSDDRVETQSVAAEGTAEGQVEQNHTEEGDRHQMTTVSVDDGEFESTQSRGQGNAANSVAETKENSEDNE